MKKKIFAASLFAIAILVGAALTLSTFLQNLRPQIEGDFMSPIEKPATDFVDANFAWNVYRPVWEKFGFGETDDGRFEEIFVNVEEPDGQVVDTRSVNPNDDWLWTQAVEKLRRSEELLEGLRHGGSKVYWRVPYAWNENVAEKSLRDKIVLTKHLFWWHPQNALRQEVYGQLGNSVLGYTDPQLQKLVLAARLLIVDTRWAVEQGDVSRIVENVRTIFCFSNQASRSYSAAGNWIYLRIKTLGNDLLKEIICRHRELLTLSDVEDLLEMHRTNFPMQYVDLDWFRKGLLDLLQRMYSGEGVGTGVLTAQGFNILKCDYENSFHEYPVKSTWVF
ncbi:MAG TPA: hypothetical protein PKD64_00770, partial [Pirellulaceae bacterium]|nr:hypothetical protein [Pirellulaceae bacterium]